MNPSRAECQRAEGGAWSWAQGRMLPSRVKLTRAISGDLIREIEVSPAPILARNECQGSSLEVYITMSVYTFIPVAF